MDPQVIRPERRFLTKIIVQAFFVFLIVALPSSLFGYFVAADTGGPSATALGVGLPLGISLLGLIIALALLPPYYRSLRYLIFPDEVVVEVGIITKSVKHVPYRTVTNLQVARGPFDRLFGLGTLKIQTAGMSGQSGTEESLWGLEEVTAVYEQVGSSLRRFRGAMPATGGLEHEPEMRDGSLEAILAELRAIRRTLEERS